MSKPRSVIVASLVACALACGGLGCGGATDAQPRLARTKARLSASTVCATYVAAPAGPATIEASDSEFVWASPCIEVKAGTAVTINSSEVHPLDAMPLDDDDAVAVNPFAEPTMIGWMTPQTKTLTEPGLYGFFCTYHGNPVTGEGMTGVIRVVP